MFTAQSEIKYLATKSSFLVSSDHHYQIDILIARLVNVLKHSENILQVNLRALEKELFIILQLTVIVTFRFF